ncbi:MAG: DMT family transporter [Chloroflexota bacterium]|nr:DMT family transporter [Chloroflexota bacterium]
MPGMVAVRWIKLASLLTLWASSFILNEIALRDLNPAAVVTGRWLVTAVLTVFLLIRRDQMNEFRGAIRSEFFSFFLLSMVGVTLLYGLQIAGQAHTSAVNTGLLANTVPIFTALLATIFFGQQVGLAGWIGIVLALVGAWVVSANGFLLDFDLSTAFGDLLVLLSALMGAFYFVIGGRLLEAYPPLIVTTAAATMGALTLLPIALVFGGDSTLTLPALAAVLILGIGPGLLANLWWWETAEWLTANRAAVYIYLIPLITMVFAMLFLGETITQAQLMGTFLVLGGVWLAERSISSISGEP